MEVRRQIYYHVRHVYRQIQRVKTWQLLIILLLGGFVAATFLRINNTGMDIRRQAVIEAANEGKDGDAADRLLDLQHYVAGHMNTSTGPFYLEGLYNRDRQAAIERAAADSDPGGSVNAQVAEVCDPQFSWWSQAYVQCFIDELNKYPSAPDLESDPTLPHPASYRHSFSAPLWSPDFAGFSVLFTAIVGLIILGRGLYFGVLMVLLKLRQGRFGG